MLDPRDRRPMYIQIAAAIRTQIHTGELQPGDRIPSARAMHDIYGVSQETGLKAIGILEAEGLVEVRPSLGSVVAERPRIVQISASYVTQEGDHPRATWRTAMADNGRDGDQEILGVARVVAPDEVAARLLLDEQGMVVVRRRVMLVDQHPYQLADSYFPVDVAAGTRLERLAKIKGGSIAALIELGHEPVRFREELTFHPASPDQQRALVLGETAWVVRALRTAYAEGGRPVEVADMLLAADRHALVYEFPARL